MMFANYFNHETNILQLSDIPVWYNINQRNGSNTASKIASQ